MVGWMDFPPGYLEALERPPMSVLLALLPPEAELPGVTEIRQRLEERVPEVTASEVTADHSSSRARWELTLVLAPPVATDAGDEPIEARVWAEPAPGSDVLADDIGWRGVTDDDVELGRSSRWALGVGLFLGPHPTIDYHQQVRLLHAVAPDAVVALDMNAYSPHPGEWLREAATARTPPSPLELFTIHSVAAEGGPVWLHTHGLDRCATLELDMVDVPLDSAGLIAQILNTVATMFIEGGVPDPDEPFLPGKDLELLWLPWEKGVAKVKRGIPGGRADRDPEHSGARGVLFAPRKGLLGRRYESPAVYGSLMEGNPLLYVSNMETDRMALLAEERLDRFRVLQGHFGEQEEWLFLVKLGFPIDDAPTERDREHLWFEVQSLVGEHAEATLLNEPYAIASMHEGERGSHPLSRLSDWAIICEHGRFGPDTVPELERLVAAAGGD